MGNIFRGGRWDCFLCLQKKFKVLSVAEISSCVGRVEVEGEEREMLAIVSYFRLSSFCRSLEFVLSLQ